MDISIIISILAIFVSILAIFGSLFAIYLNFVKEKKSELFTKKRDFYEELIKEINLALFHEDKSCGRNISKMYNLSFIFANDKVIKILNEYCKKSNFGGSISFKTLFPIYNKLFRACRKDLGIPTKLTEKDYIPPGKVLE